MKSKVLVLSGAEHISIENTCDYDNGRFKNGETAFRLNCSVRYKPVTILQSFPDTNNNLMELMLAVDACSRAGAKSISVVLLIFPYARQDRRHKSGVPISAKVVCDMLNHAVDRVVTFDLHNDAIEGMMNTSTKFIHIEMTSFLAYNLKKQIHDIHDYVFVSPDAGAIKRTKKLADACGAKDLCIMDKTRTEANVVDGVKLIGDVQYRNVLIPDDMIDTGGTLVKGTTELSDHGCYDQVVVGTHPIFSPPAFVNLNGLNVMTTNTLPIPAHQDGESIESLTVFPIYDFIHTLIYAMDEGQPYDQFFRWNG